MDLAERQSRRGILRDLAGILGLTPATDHDARWMHFVTTQHKKFVAHGTNSPHHTEFSARLTGRGWSQFSCELVRFWTHPLQNGIVCELADSYQGELRSIMMLQALQPLYESVIRNSGGLFLHAAVLRISERALVIAGTGGIGKTTFCNRCPHRGL